MTAAALWCASPQKGRNPPDLRKPSECYITGIMDDLGEEFCQQFAKDAETLLQAIERQNEKLLAEKEKMP